MYFYFMAENPIRKLKLNKPLIIFYILVFYIFASFIWWSYLLLENNRITYRQTRNIRIIELKQQGISQEQIDEMDLFQDLEARHQRQVWMVIGEGIVFLILLALAVWQIRKSFQREITLAKQQRNFLLSITHELKSPIASVKLALETLFKRDLDKERAQRLIFNSLSDTERLQNLVEDILFAAKFEDHQFQFAHEIIDFSELVNKFASKAVEQYGEKREFNVQIKPELQVMGDRQALSALVNNLIENAIKYSYQGSDIQIQLQKDDEKLIYCVTDEGVGISDEEKENIFKKFYRIGNEETRKAKGTGLGLFIVKEVVEGHNGTIKVKDNNPRGSKFIVELPLLNNSATEMTNY